MPYCSRCGVEVDSTVKRCPLCETPVQVLPPDGGSPWPVEEAPPPNPPPMSADERKALARTITTLGFLIPASVVLTVDWFLARRLTWSLYVLVSLAAAWLWALIPLVWGRHPFRLIGAVTLVALATEVSIAMLSGDTSWLLPIGLPVVACAGLLGAGVTSLGMRSTKLGGNLAGWILVALSLLTMIVDVLVSARLRDIWRPGWSIIVVSTLVPIATLLLYLHYSPSRQRRLRRYFHV